MPPIRHTRSRGKSSERSREKRKRPTLNRMVVSVNRHKSSSDNGVWNSQIPLYLCAETKEPPSRSWNDRIELENLEFDLLMKILDDDMDVEDEEDVSLVWRMSDSSELGLVRDDASLQTAILDCQNTGKSIVKIYVVSKHSEFHSTKSLVQPS